MPVAPTYPGVYVEEIPSGAHPITGVPTAVGAFIGWFPKGTSNKAIELLSWADVEREYGGLHLKSDASFALYQFFLNGGARAWGVRVGLSKSGAGNAFASASVAVPKAGGGGSFLTLTALNEGTWGSNIAAQVVGGVDATHFDLVVQLIGSANNRPAVAQEERFRSLTIATAADPKYVPTAVNNGSKLITAAVSGASPTVALSGAVSGAITFPVTIAAGKQVNVSIGGTTTLITLPAATLNTAIDLADYLQSAIRTANGSSPAWALASVNVTQTTMLQVLSGVGDPANVLVADVGPDTTASATLKMPTVAAPGAYPLAGGYDGVAPSASEYVGSPSAGTGMYALENTDFTLLSIPAIANQTVGALDGLLNGTGYDVVTANAITYCQKKRALFLVDPPDNATSVTQIQTWLTTESSLRDSYTALYYPRITVPDPTQNFLGRSIGTSGTIAGLMSRIDTNRGVWKAPAGTEATLRGLQAIDTNLTDPENGVLNPLAINCLRNFPAYGNVSWGARTLAGSDATSSDYKYVPVRRLANFLESSLQIGLKWVVFEPNDEPLWSQIRLNVSVFMQTLFRQGAFAGKAPRDAYIVKCDSSTTTPDDQAKGVVNVLVGFAPVRPAEFVILQIQQIAGQTQA